MKITQIKIHNYRTIETLDLKFTEPFTAICGPNDCGKTNVVRVIRALMQEQDRFAFRNLEQVSTKENYPKWKQSDSGEKCVELTVEIVAEKYRDIGLYQFLIKQLGLTTDPDTLTLLMTVSHKGETSEPNVSVKVNEKVFDGLDAQEVLKKLRSSKTVLFHNSTNSGAPFRRGIGGVLSDLTGESEVDMANMRKSVDRSLKKIAKKHQRQFEELLGRLDSKYHVGLSLPDFDIGYFPYSITLGQKHFDVPLDDWGSGTQNRTMILMTLFRAKEISLSVASASKITPLIVIEEPESFLHPSAQAELGRVIHDLADEFQVQVIVTTHSPYMLRHDRPASNLLLQRRTSYGQLRDTLLVDTSTDKWMEPFGLALGLSSEEFAPWKDLFFSGGDAVMLVEGDIDKEYFELLRDPKLGPHQLQFKGQIVPYDGAGSLQNSVLLRFIRNTFKRMFVTADLDMESALERNFKALGFVKNKDYAWVGVNAAGRKNIEGLLPDSVTTTVYAANPSLVQAATSGTADEQKDAKNKLKKLLLMEFKSKAKVSDGSYTGFYSLVRLANKQLCS